MPPHAGGGRAEAPASPRSSYPLIDAGVESRDKYGRLLAYVYLGDERYNDRLLKLGYARLLVIPPNGSDARAMLHEEIDARAAGVGLWGACEGL